MNATIDSCYGNLKSIMKPSHECFDGHRLDSLTYHLVGDVVMHYWYAVQCKFSSFIRNKKQERIVVTSIGRARGILDCVVRIFPNNVGIALVALVNHRTKMWIVHGPNSKWV